LTYISMDFVIGLSRERRVMMPYRWWWINWQNLFFFLHIKMTDLVDKLTKLYIHKVIRLHGVLVSIISDRDPRFTSRLWPNLQKALGIKLNLSTTFHPQTDGQSERTIQTLEDLLLCAGVWRELRGSPTIGVVYL
jgi:hypothetical protein